MGYALDVPPPPNPEHWEFLALGDTGDSDAAGPGLSPQDGVAQFMAEDAALPGKNGRACLVVHTGDVIYMTGERRLYDRNFRRPYAPFLAPHSTAHDLVFRLPFLPVPGNHDYYDLGGWARWLAHVPILGTGLRAIAHQLFAFSLPEGGSDMGRAYMESFVDARADTSEHALPYVPGKQTRLPNRYYRFQIGSVDFFALDSNTLDAPPPDANIEQVKADAVGRVDVLQTRAKTLDRDIRREQRALDRARRARRQEVLDDPERGRALVERAPQVAEALAKLLGALRNVPENVDARGPAVEAVAGAERRWSEGAADLAVPATADALGVLEEASDDSCASLQAVEACLSRLEEGLVRAQLLGARGEVDQALERWSELAAPSPPELNARLHGLSESALDVQRELALERRRVRYRPSDHDRAQMEWLEASLREAEQARPNNWRVVYLHHPLYTTIANHCERPDVQDLRDNVLARLQGRVHLVLSGHSHAFEWFRSDALPHTGIVVTGGGGQISLRPSLLDPRLLHRHRNRYDALRAAGVREVAVAGRGPVAPDGEAGMLYHYVRIEVTPDALFVRPVGVRRLETGYRREMPMPVFHAAELGPARASWKSHRLESIEVRRDQPPRAHWT